jgi:tRNA(adenine34) deaminase
LAPAAAGPLDDREPIICRFAEPSDEAFMTAALRQARRAADADEVPVGAVVVRDGRIIGTGHNQRQTLADPTAHAEMIALTAAAADVGDWRLDGCSLYVTLEPCAMCAGACVLARLQRIVYGADDPKGGAVRSLYQICSDPRLNHQVQVTAGVLAAECGAILTEYFAAKRRRMS